MCKLYFIGYTKEKSCYKGSVCSKLMLENVAVFFGKCNKKVNTEMYYK